MSNETTTQPTAYDKELMSLISEDLAQIQVKLEGKIEHSWTILKCRSSNINFVLVDILFSSGKREQYEIDIVDEWKNLKPQIIKKACVH